MSDSPPSSLVAYVQKMILDTFDVSEQEALDHASGLVALATSWGTPETAANLDWQYRIKKDLGEKLKWRSETAHNQFTNERQSTVRAYNEFIRHGKTS